MKGFAVTRQALRRDAGFTLVELLTVLLILGILVMIGFPIYTSAANLAEQRTCFHNQNTLARATEVYLAVDRNYRRADLAGPVNKEHPIVVNHIVGAVPRCPAGADPVDPDHPTIAEGAYSFDASGSLMPCTLGRLGAHGAFDD